MLQHVMIKPPKPNKNIKFHNCRKPHADMQHQASSCVTLRCTSTPALNYFLIVVNLSFSVLPLACELTLTGRLIPWKYSGMYRGRMTFSCSTLFASARPAMSSQDTPGLASSMSLYAPSIGGIRQHIVTVSTVSGCERLRVLQVLGALINTVRGGRGGQR